MSWYGFRPYVSVARRRANALREVSRLEKKGRKTSPVRPMGRKIATTFWGKAWCDNLESYSDYSNRLPRGRTYIRNGSVVDLQIEPGRITALVSGSDLYEVKIKIKPSDGKSWKNVKTRCAGGIGSLVELLQGKLSSSVMQVVTSSDGGLFPKPKEIELSCSCPDGAYMCKHVAAVLYGVGTRLDEQPDLLFKLRQVDHLELIVEAGNALGTADARPGSGETTIAAGDLADVFGIEIDAPQPPIQVQTTDPTVKPSARKARPAATAVKVNKPGRTSEKTKPEPSGKSGRPPRKSRGYAADGSDVPGATAEKNSTTDYTDFTDKKSRKALRTQ
jgi:uncharacterized Zn finger protein